jgi:ubiquinone/menaquinone biosynthesis C-methylase UbiE
MADYYSEKLNSLNLQKCYELAPERVKQFLEAEINFVLSKICPTDIVLDLGCGYGRVAIKLIEKARKVVGIDISKENILYAEELYKMGKDLQFYEMDAANLSFQDNSYDMTICIQNGISAFKIDPLLLIKEALRVTKIGGIILFSSYSSKFWNDRLNWFKIQSKYGLIGEIDFDRTKDGIIVCKDGFIATTFSEKNFLDLASNFNVDTSIYEIDNSSLFCEMRKN